MDNTSDEFKVYGKLVLNVSYVNSEVLEAESMNIVVVRDATRFRRRLLLSTSGWNEA